VVDIPAIAPSSPADELAAAATGGKAVTSPSQVGAETTLSRGDVRLALADFAKLTASVHGAFTPAGVRIDGLAAGSIFVKAGLKSGDLVTAVDGKPIKSLDDAADLYVRATSARNISIQIVRNGKPTTLRVTIQ
jgi:S1-C subfamily serine protease